MKGPRGEVEQAARNVFMTAAIAGLAGLLNGRHLEDIQAIFRDRARA